jgi:hypothetical protein
MKPEIRPETKMVRNCRNKSSKVHIASNIIRASFFLSASVMRAQYGGLRRSLSSGRALRGTGWANPRSGLDTQTSEWQKAMDDIPCADGRVRA